MTITAVIPTRNRPQDLIKAVSSILDQTRLPDELLIIDQSSDSQSFDTVQALMAGKPAVALVYVHESKISGLVEAKRVAAGIARGDIVCFLEDDVVLESEFLEQIRVGFECYPSMLGCCGVVTNPPNQSYFYNVLFHLFHRGIYRDKRQGIYGQNRGDNYPLIESDHISGGLSAWRREVFDTVRFDTANDFFMLEDMEFSTRAAAELGNHFFINPNARLEHHASPVNRARLPARQRRKMREYIVFYKKRKTWPMAAFSLAWLMLGLFMESLFQTLRYLSPSLSVNYFAGIFDGVRWKLKTQ